MRTRTAIMLATVAIVLPTAALATDPATTLGYTGVLLGNQQSEWWTDNPGGGVVFRFRLCREGAATCDCDNASADCLWQQEFTDVTVTGGHFSVELGGSSQGGAVPSADLTTVLGEADGLALEVERDGTVQQPRVRLARVPFAVHADQVAWDGVVDRPTLQVGGVPAGKNTVINLPSSVTDGTVGWADVQSGAPTYVVQAGQPAKDVQATLAWLVQQVQAQAATIADLQAKNTELQKRLDDCPSDMKRVGDFCVDVVEASVWAKNVDDGVPIDCEALQEAVNKAIDAGLSDATIYNAPGSDACAANPGMDICQYRQYGSPNGAACPGGDCDDYPTATWPDSGNWTKPLYACAIKGVYPSRSLTWFQAQQACTASGRHLITNGEWQAAVAGTIDPGENNGHYNGKCNTNAGSLGVRSTGAAGSDSPPSSDDRCVSRWGVEDMIGNLDEWADLWGQAGFPWMSASAVGIDEAKSPWPAGYGDTCGTEPNETSCDKTMNVNGESSDIPWHAGLPFTPVRGGYWNRASAAGAFAFNADYGPSAWTWVLGFRCSRGM